MTDTVHSFRSPIYADTKAKRLPPSFYWGLGFAVLLHAVLAYYLIQQNFTGPVVVQPPGETILGQIYNPPVVPPKAHPDQAPKKVIVVHPPIGPTPTTVTTVPIAPIAGPIDNTGPLTPPTISSAQGSSDTTSSASGPSFVKARWTRFPDANALTDYYPARAADDEVEGTATVQCVVIDTQGRVSCSTVSETPKGYNFGSQTVKMVQDKGRVDTSHGDVKIGDVLRTVVHWQLGQ